jgi:mono/diheme cytochrome c family protein
MLRSLKCLFLGVVLLLVSAIGGLLAFIYSGLYDVAATRQHTAPVYWAVITALRQSIRAHAAGGALPPDLTNADLIAAGLILYDRHCAQCHGAPGIAPDAIALGMMPSPPNFALMGHDLPAPEIYWAVSNGIKMTGMPAWEFRLTERERWAVVAFLKQSPALTPAEYRAQRARLITARGGESTSHTSDAHWEPDGAVQRGRVAIQQYACQTCHVIPGIRGPDAQVGPPLSGIAGQVYLAGVLLNTPDHMSEWLQNPQRIKPLTAMPNMGVTERDARDIGAYLYTLR